MLEVPSVKQRLDEPRLKVRKLQAKAANRFFRLYLRFPSLARETGKMEGQERKGGKGEKDSGWSTLGRNGKISIYIIR